MMSFREFVMLMESARTGDYVGARYDVSPNQKFYDWFDSLDVPGKIPHADVHTTIMYSTSVIPTDHHINRSVGIGEISCRPIGFDMFGKNKDALVLLLDCPEFSEMHSHLREVGGTPTFDEYHPHLTISYNAPDFDINRLTVPDFSLQPTSIYTEPLDEDWV